MQTQNLGQNKSIKDELPSKFESLFKQFNQLQNELTSFFEGVMKLYQQTKLKSKVLYSSGDKKVDELSKTWRPPYNTHTQSKLPHRFKISVYSVCKAKKKKNRTKQIIPKLTRISALQNNMKFRRKFNDLVLLDITSRKLFSTSEKIVLSLPTSFLSSMDNLIKIGKKDLKVL